MLLFLISCLSDHILTNKIIEERILYDTAYVEVIVEVEKEVEVEIIVEEEYPVWAQSYIQPSLGNGVDILWVVDPSGSMMNNWAQVALGVEQMLIGVWKLFPQTKTEQKPYNHFLFCRETLYKQPKRIFKIMLSDIMKKEWMPLKTT